MRVGLFAVLVSLVVSGCVASEDRRFEVVRVTEITGDGHSWVALISTKGKEMELVETGKAVLDDETYYEVKRGEFDGVLHLARDLCVPVLGKWPGFTQREVLIKSCP